MLTLKYKPMKELLEEFAGTFEVMSRPRILAVLQKSININGRLRPRCEYAIESVAAGAKVGVAEHKPALVFPDGRYMLESAITKIALRFADWLCEERELLEA